MPPFPRKPSQEIAVASDNRALIRRFIDNLNAGTPDLTMFTPDWTVWTLSTGTDEPGTADLEGNRLLMSLFPAGLRYTAQAILIDGNRAAARMVGEGTLHSGETYRNDYVFLFELHDGRIARIEEFFDTRPVTGQIMPLMVARLDEEEAD